MRDEQLEKMITNTFEGFEISQGPESRTWSLRHPEKRSHWYKVTWTPGHLMISGDLNEITFTHYHALPTWQDAVRWARNADHHYLLEKSNTKTEFDADSTVVSLIRMADEDQQWDEEAELWRKLFDFFGGMLYSDNYDLYWAEKLNHKNKAHQMKVIKSMRENACELSPETLHREFYIDDYYGDYSWNAQAIWQARALNLWAEKVYETELAQEEQPKTEATKGQHFLLRFLTPLTSTIHQLGTSRT